MLFLGCYLKMSFRQKFNFLFMSLKMSNLIRLQKVVTTTYQTHIIIALADFAF